MKKIKLVNFSRSEDWGRETALKLLWEELDKRGVDLSKAFYEGDPRVEKLLIFNGSMVNKVRG